MIVCTMYLICEKIEEKYFLVLSKQKFSKTNSFQTNLILEKNVVENK